MAAGARAQAGQLPAGPRDAPGVGRAPCVSLCSGLCELSLRLVQWPLVFVQT